MTKSNNRLPEFVTLDKLGSDIKVSIRSSTKAKRIAIKIRHHKVELIVPNKKLSEAYNFLLTKESWVRNKLAITFKQTKIDKEKIAIFDQEYSLQFVQTNENKVIVLNNKPLSKPVSGSELVGVSTTQSRNVLNNISDLSIQETQQDAAEIQFRKRFINDYIVNKNGI